MSSREHKHAEAQYAELFDFDPFSGENASSEQQQQQQDRTSSSKRSCTCIKRCCAAMRRRRREAPPVPIYLPTFVVILMMFVTISVQKPWESSSSGDEIPRDSALLRVVSEDDDVVRLGYVSGNCHDNCAVLGVSFEGCPPDLLNDDDLPSYVVDNIMPLLQNETIKSFGTGFQSDVNNKNRYVCNGLTSSHTGILVVDTRFPVDIYIKYSTSISYDFLFSTQFQEHNTYDLKLFSSSSYELNLTHDSNTNTNLPIFISLLVIGICCILGTFRAFWLPSITRFVVRVSRSGSQDTVKSEDMMPIPLPSPATIERLNGGDLAIGAPWGPKNVVHDTKRKHRRGSDDLFQSWSGNDTKTDVGGTPKSSDSMTTSIMKQSSTNKDMSSSLQKPKTVRITSSTSSVDTRSLRVSSELMHHLGSLDRTNQKRSKRLKSLDTFRGLALTIMIFVNYGGGGYFFFAHSAWNGLTVADLVFPWFMWIMGVSMALSFSRRKPQLYTILRRSFILFAIGLFLNSDGITDHPLNEYRIPGVLQYFAVSFLVCGLTVLSCEHTSFAKRLSSSGDNGEGNLIRRAQGVLYGNIVSPFGDENKKSNAGGVFNSMWRLTADIWMFWPEWIVMVLLLGVYMSIQTYLHDDSCPAGYIGAGTFDVGRRWSALDVTFSLLLTHK